MCVEMSSLMFKLRSRFGSRSRNVTTRDNVVYSTSGDALPDDALLLQCIKFERELYQALRALADKDGELYAMAGELMYKDQTIVDLRTELVLKDQELWHIEQELAATTRIQPRM